MSNEALMTTMPRALHLQVPHLLFFGTVHCLTMFSKLLLLQRDFAKQYVYLTCL